MHQIAFFYINCKWISYPRTIGGEISESLGNATLLLFNEVRAMDFVATYAKAETVQDKIKCHIAKCLGAKVVTPMGRILLLPKDYIQKAIETGNADLIN